MEKTIKYSAAVMVDAGWRSVEIEARAELNSTGKKATVIEVIAIDGEKPAGTHSRTGAKRQQFFAPSIAKREIGAVKLVSKLISIT